MHIPAETLSRIVSQVEPLNTGMSASLALHLLMVHGFDAQFRQGRLTSSQELLRLFTDDEFGRAYFGAPVMTRSRYGIRPSIRRRDGSTQERHNEQTLAAMAQLGVPLSLPITVGHEEYTLRDVLRDSIASFDLHQDELEWTTVAYASYLPPFRQWENKFGDIFSFDQLAEELLRRDCRNASCCGCHIVEAMVTLTRIDGEKAQLLSEEVRIRLMNRLKDIARLVVRNQAADGSWGPDWYVGLEPGRPLTGESPDSHATRLRLLATSHIAHWLLYLPQELQVSPTVVLQAGKWLYKELRDVDPAFVRVNFCPCCHGAWILRTLSQQSTETAPASWGAQATFSQVERFPACKSRDK